MQKYYVIIDSNFLFLPIQFKIDYLHEIFLNLGGKSNLILFQQILNELNSKLKRETQARKFKMDFEASLQYLDMNKGKYSIQYLNKVKKDNETTDEFLLQECISYKTEGSKVFLATNDSKLRNKANQHGIHTIYLKQKKYLVFD